jgi:hypothetical protein
LFEDSVRASEASAVPERAAAAARSPFWPTFFKEWFRSDPEARKETRRKKRWWR